jgi:hypothetical protein
MTPIKLVASFNSAEYISNHRKPCLGAIVSCYFYSACAYRFGYFDDLTYTIGIVPEPSTAAPGTGLGALFVRRRIVRASRIPRQQTLALEFFENLCGSHDDSSRKLPRLRSAMSSRA